MRVGERDRDGQDRVRTAEGGAAAATGAAAFAGALPKADAPLETVSLTGFLGRHHGEIGVEGVVMSMPAFLADFNHRAPMSPRSARTQ